MTGSKIPATIVAIATYVIVAGIFTESGVILQPAAIWFHAGVPDTAVLFSYLNAGNVSGILVSLFAFNLFSIRTVLVAAYACAFAGVAAIVSTHDLGIAGAAIFAIGLGVGTGLSAGAVILAKLYADRRRAIAFLGTDCAFSAAGFVFPALAGAMLAAKLPWGSGYLSVMVLPVVLLALIAWIRFPATGRGVRVAADPVVSRTPRGAYLSVGLFALALALYLMGQNVFTIWAPTVLQDLLGVPALRAGTIVSSFYGPSSLGLLTAAFVVSRVPPRIVLTFAVTMGALLTFALASLHDAQAFFFTTFAFGFSTTCAYKLMISIGSEQLPSSPPSLVTFLLFCSSIGGTLAPAVSAQVVRSFGLHASLWMSATCYAAALLTVIAMLLVERSRRRAVQLAAA